MKVLFGFSRKGGAFKVLLSLAVLVSTLSSCSGQSGLMKLTSQPGGSATVAPTSFETQNSYADTVSRVSPAVVTIRSTERTRAARQFPFMDDPTFREFFGDRLPQQPPQRVQGVGSGVIVNSQGYILTNHHVVDGALEIKVELTDNRTFTAKLVGSDPPSDLAVLKVDATNLPTLTLGDSDKVRVGDVVLAIGNPLGIGQTVTSGIISAKGRATGLSDGSFEDFLQTDAAINRGNSGGALINTSGELVGINSQILSPSGGNIGIGFAIPSNMARAVMDQLLKTGKVRRGMLGVTIQSVDADLASSLNLPAARGAIVTSVASGSPAESAGVRRGDVITSVNNQPISDRNSLRNAVASMPPGTTVNVKAVRDGREASFNVALAELPDNRRSSTEENDSGSGSNTGRYGMSLQPLTADMASRMGLPANEQGLVVSRIDPDGAAADAGLRQGDLIQEVNRRPVRNLTEFTAAAQQSGSRPALLLVKRGEATVYITLRPGS
ncbi:MAG TPA: DegQ family serine endoprotease [Pyrinomonadaceae bacterium]|nr:DegQ family serine endoprotease [Pyrinomonadaceae bacterium]